MSHYLLTALLEPVTNSSSVPIWHGPEGVFPMGLQDSLTSMLTHAWAFNLRTHSYRGEVKQ